MFRPGDNVVTSIGEGVVISDDGGDRVFVRLDDGRQRRCARRTTEYLPTRAEIERDKAEIRKHWVPRCDPRMWGSRPVYPHPNEETQEDEMGD